MKARAPIGVPSSSSYVRWRGEFQAGTAVVAITSSWRMVGRRGMPLYVAA